MANLSGNLGGVNEAARVVEAPAMSSGLGTAVNSLAKGFDTVSDVFTQRATAKRQAAAEARAAEDQAWDRENRSRTRAGWAAEDYAGTALNTLNNAAVNGLTTTVETPVGPPPIDSSMEGFIGNAGSQLSKVRLSVEQGRLPPMALQGLATKLFNEGINNGIPAGLLAKSFKERGVDSFHGYESQTADVEAQEKAEREERAAAYKAGAESLGPALEGKTDDEIVNVGRSQLAQAAKLDAATKAATLQSTMNSDQRATNTDVREQNDRDASGMTALTFDTAIGPMLDGLLRTSNPAAAPERGSDTTYEMKQAKIVAAAPQYFQQVKAQVLNRMTVSGASPQAVAQAGAQIDNRINGILEGLNAGGKAYQSAATLISTSFGLRMETAAPLISQMKKLGIDYAAIPGLMDAMSPQVKARFGSQMKSILSDGLVDSAEKTAFKNLVAVATGKANITDLDTAAGRRTVVQQAATYTSGQAREIAAGGGHPDVWLSMHRQVAIGAASLTPQSSAADIAAATKVNSGNGTIDAFNKLRSGPNGEEAQLAGSAARGASARLLKSAQVKLDAVLRTGDDKYQIRQYDENTGQWRFVFNDKLWTAENRGRRPGALASGFVPMGSGAQAGARAKPTGPSQEAQQLLTAMNGNLAFLTRSGEWDDDSPKGTYREVSAYWATGKPTSDMQKKAETKRSRGSIYDLQDKVLESFSHIPDIETDPNADIVGPEGSGKNPRSSANGFGQFTESTWIATMKKHFPELIEGKSKADILDMRQNKALGTKATAAYRADNAAYLAGKGLPSGRTATALAHFAGPQGAESLLTADPNAPVENVLGAAAVRANPHLRGKTAGQTIEWAKGFYRA